MHYKLSGKKTSSAGDFFEKGKDDLVEEDGPFLPPITPKKNKPKSKAFVLSREIATQITADALVPKEPLPDYWINKDTVISVDGKDPFDDLALKVQRYHLL